MQHQVEWGHAAGAAVAVPIDSKELIAQVDARKLLAQGREILPVDRRAVVVEQPGLCERISPGAERTERNAPLREALQRREQLRRDCLLHIDATTDEQDVDGSGALEW